MPRDFAAWVNIAGSGLPAASGTTPVAEVTAAKVEVEFDPPDDLEQLLADAAADLPGTGPADPDTTTAETTAGTTATKES